MHQSTTAPPQVQHETVDGFRVQAVIPSHATHATVWFGELYVTFCVDGAPVVHDTNAPHLIPAALWWLLP